MTSRFCRFAGPSRTTVVVIAGVFVWMGFNVGLAVAEDEKLPSAESLMDKFIELTGDKEAYAKIRNRVVVSNINDPNQNLQFEQTAYLAEPNMIYLTRHVPEFGEFVMATDGTNAWQSNVAQQVLLKDVQKERAIRDALFLPEFNWKKLYATVTCVGTEEIEGKACYKVEASPKEGKPDYLYFDQATGLKTKKKMTFDTLWGEVVSEELYDDYQEVDGIKLPHTTLVLQRDGQPIQVSIVSVEHNADIPKDRFEPPIEIKDQITAYEIESRGPAKTETVDSPPPAQNEDKPPEK